jgi:hypothetical protein
MFLIAHGGHKFENLFHSDDPAIRVKLSQLSLAFRNALLSGDRELARCIRGEAISLRLVADQEVHRKLAYVEN